MWTKSDEYEFSWPPSWPVSQATLDPIAAPYKIGKQVQATSVEEVRQAVAQGYGVTMASNYGSTSMSVVDGFLMAKWNSSWAHQMNLNGYAKHPSLGPVWLLLNQWGKSAHPACPYLSQYDVDGAFWLPEADLKKNMSLSDTEVIVHSNTGGFAVRDLTNNRMGL